MFILDTNVISEILRQQPDRSVVAWFESQPRDQLFTTAITQAEILYGLALLPKGSRRDKLSEVTHLIFEEDFDGRILAFGSDAAGHYADLVTVRKLAGRPISQFDATIASIARLHGAGIASRHTSDFESCGVEVTNPWSIM